MITRDDSVYLVAEKNGRVVGLSGLQIVSGEGEVFNVSVSPDLRRSGIAFEMLKSLLEKGNKKGCENFTLEVREGNEAARKLYEKLGFVNEGVRPGVYDNPKEDAVIYWKRKGTE